MKVAGLDRPPSLQLTFETLTADQRTRCVAARGDLVEQTPGAAELEAQQAFTAAHAFAAQRGKGRASVQGLINALGFSLVAGADLMRAAGEDGLDGVHNWPRFDDGASLGV